MEAGVTDAYACLDILLTLLGALSDEENASTT
jgi:hypothetical protein